MEKRVFIIHGWQGTAHTAGRDAGDDVNGTKRVVEGAEREISYMGQRVDKLTNDQFRNLYQHLEGIATRKLFSGHKPRGGSKNWRITYGNYL